MKLIKRKALSTVTACMKYLLLFVFVMVLSVFSAHAADGTYKVNWGTDGTNGTGGSVTSTPAIQRNTAKNYTGASSVVFDIAPTSGYYVSSVVARRTDSDGNWNNWQTLNDNDVSMIVLNNSNTTITLNTAKYNNVYRYYEIQVTFATINVNVSWGANGSANDGNGGTVTSTGKTVTNTQNVSPSFLSTDTASFTISTDSGNTISNVQYKRDDWQNWATVPGWSSGDSSFSFSINSHSWSVRVLFQIPQNVTSSVTAYYGTTNTANFNTNAADWVGGKVYRMGQNAYEIGTSSHLTSTYSLSGSKTVRITPSSGYKIVSVKWVEATWSDVNNITPVGSFTDEPVIQRYNTNTDLTLPTTYDSEFQFTASSPKSYLVWVVFAPVGATGGTVGAWYGTNNTTAFDTPQADGSGGTIWKTTGTDQQLANRNSSGVMISSDGTVTFEARPASGFKITSIQYGQDNPTSSVTVPADQTSPLSFSFTVAGGNVYKIWAVFTSTATGSFQVSGTIDPTTDASCTSNSISPASQVVNVNQTGTFTFSTSTNCMVDSVNFCSGSSCTGAGAWSGTGNTYTTPAITATSSFVVKFRPIGFNIISEIDTTSPSGCGTISPVGTNNYMRGSNTPFAITTAANCSISHVWVKDTNAGLTTDTDIAPLAGSTYTFQDLQAEGHIKVQFTSIVPTSSDSYCQIPAFVAGQASLAPNVLIIFDNSGSMGGTSGDAYYNKKTYDCTASSTLSNCANFTGYFDPGKMYKVDTTDSNKYLIDNVTLDLSSGNAKSGNYLNYRHMDKVDVVRKVLMGGKIVDRTATTKFLATNNGKTVEHGPNLPTGIVQRLSDKVRFGMMVFNDPPEGAHLAVVPNTTRKTVLGTSQDDLIAAMEGPETNPKTNTPIAEALYEAIRYYQATYSAYNNNVNYGTMDPVQSSCQKHFILLLTDGEPNSNNNLPGLSTEPTLNNYTDVIFNATTWENRITANDRATNNNSTCYSNTYHCPPTSTNNCSTNSEKVEAVAYYMHATDLRSDKEGTQNITLFPVYAFGDGTGTKTLHMAAKYGGYNNKNGNLPSPNTWSSPDEQSEWDADTDCKPDNYFEGDNGESLDSGIMNAMSSILAKVASGTAASILSNSEGSGANLLQAVFYPNKIFPGPRTSDAATEASWIGELQNLWYYVDPFVAKSSVREDTDFSTTTPNHILNLKNDYVARYYFIDGETNVEVKRDIDGDGVGDTDIATSRNPDEVNALWRAGRQLWARAASSRTIHTSVDGYSLLLPTAETPPKGGFYAPSATSTRVTALRPYLQAANNDSNAEAMKIINYIRGTDQTGYRNRTVKLLVNSATVTNEWKLGDIVSSTPRLQSTNKLGSYDKLAPIGYNDKSYEGFINSTNYKNRGMVYVGANDGMLHAFKLGKLTVASGADTGITSGSSTLKIGGFDKAALTGTGLGEEQWAYIPRNSLPYLKYFTDAVNYKHIFYVDGPTSITDVSIGKSVSCTSDYSLCRKDTSAGTNWRTVLVGSMGLGGATKLSTNSCSTAASGGTCVKTPIFDPDDTAATKTRGVGYSSYFAFDVTDQYFNSTTGALENQPVLKWEFPPREAADNFGLGYATSGVAIIRIAAKLPADGAGVIKPDTTANGKWFAVFASGPTGPIDTSVHRFMGRSDQNMKLFVVDLGATIDADHPFALNTNYWVIDTGIADAFAGSISNGGIDVDRWKSDLDGNYQDDAVYVGYTKKRTDSLTGEVSWTDGGVGRLLTKESTNPSEWAFSRVIDGIGPVTTDIAKLQDRKNKKLWLFFGTGRFFYTGDDALSASSNQRYIMGIQDPCYTADNKIDSACSSSALTLSSLKNQTTSIATNLGTDKGWYISLDAKDDSQSLGAERTVTNTVSLVNGGVFFTTFKPTTDVCKYGGFTYIWGVNYATGGTASAAALSGKALIQLSTGAFKEVPLQEVMTDKDFRKMGSPMIGKPPLDAPPIISNAGNKPPKKILHIQEK